MRTYHHIPLSQRPDGAWARASAPTDDDAYPTLTDLVRDYSAPGVDVYRIRAGSPERPRLIDPPEFLFVAYSVDDDEAPPVYFGADWCSADDEPAQWEIDAYLEGRPCES